MKTSNRTHAFLSLGSALLASTTTAFAAVTMAYHVANSTAEMADTHVKLALILIGAFAFSLSAIVLHYQASMDKSRLEKSQLANQNKQLSLLIENIPDVIWTFDGDGTPLYVSHQSQAVFGISPQDFLRMGKNAWWSLIHSEDLPQVKISYEKLIATGSPLDIQYRIKRPDGTISWVRHKSTYVGKIGNGAQAVGVIADITKYKLATSELEKRSADLEKINSIMIGREARMADLKKELDQLKKKTSFEHFVGGSI